MISLQNNDLKDTTKDEEKSDDSLDFFSLRERNELLEKAELNFQSYTDKVDRQSETEKSPIN